MYCLSIIDHVHLLITSEHATDTVSTYRNDHKFSDRHVWANGVDPDQEQFDQGLHCLLDPDQTASRGV